MPQLLRSSTALAAALFVCVACGGKADEAAPVGGAINALPAPTVQPVQTVKVPPPPTDAVVPTDLNKVYDIEESKPAEGIDRVYDIEETKPRDLSETATERTLDPQQPKVVLPGASPGGKPQPKAKTYTPPPTPESPQ